MEIDQEILMKLDELNHKSNYLGEQLQVIDKQISELDAFGKTLDSLGEDSTEKEILAPLGKGVYAKSDIKDPKLFVEIGSGIVIRKTIPETKDVISDQSRKLQEMKLSILSENENVQTQMEKIIQDLEKSNSQQTI